MKAISILNKVKTALVAIAIIAVAAVIYMSIRTVKSTDLGVVSDNRIDITPEQIESIKAIGEWEFLSVSDEEMVDTIRKGFFSDSRLVRIYYGTMRLGLNMHHVKPGWIEASGDTVRLTLPPIELLDNDFIDEARTRSFHESGRWTANDREAMYRQAHRMMLAKGMTDANINRAKDNADAQMRQMMRAMGFNTIIIRFEK